MMMAEGVTASMGGRSSVPTLTSEEMSSPPAAELMLLPEGHRYWQRSMTTARQRLLSRQSAASACWYIMQATFQARFFLSQVALLIESLW